MDLKKEQKIKNRLGLLLKVLLIALATFKLVEFTWNNMGKRSAVPSEKNDSSVIVDSTITDVGEDGESETTNENKENRVVKPVENAASIYIFGSNGLDSQTSRHIGNVFFNDYKMMTTTEGFQKDQLLLGNLKSSANTELVCVGTVAYSYTKDDQKNTCELSLQFDTYNKNTGEKIKQLSKAMVQYGIGFSNSQARQVALAKVHL